LVGGKRATAVEIRSAVAFSAPLCRRIGKVLGTTGCEALFSSQCVSIKLTLKPGHGTIGAGLGVAAFISVIARHVCMCWIRGILVHRDAGGGSTAPFSRVAIASGGLTFGISDLS
jgi:hypothetical protein